MHLHLALRPQPQPRLAREPLRRRPRLRRHRGPPPRRGYREDQPVIAPGLFQRRLHRDALIREELAHHLPSRRRPGLKAEKILEPGAPPTAPNPPRLPPLT